MFKRSKCLADARGQRSEVRFQQIVARLVPADRKATVTTGPNKAAVEAHRQKNAERPSLIGHSAADLQTRKTSPTAAF